MKTVLTIATVLAALWVWTHHTVTDERFCLTAPRQVCLEHSTPAPTAPVAP